MSDTDPVVVLQAENLMRCYGDLTAVRDLSLCVYQGEILGLLGSNGAGKTTTINMICGLLKPDHGRVILHGQVVSQQDGIVRKRVGMCPQETIVWDKLTCLEQLIFIGQMYQLPARLARQRGKELLDTLGLADKAGTLAGILSGGMRRRLNLALALVHDPEMVVLDEPEAGLDPQSRIMVREFIRSLARKKTVILTTHNMDEAERVADRVAIIDHGELLVLDSPRALKQRLGGGDVIEMRLEAVEEGVPQGLEAFSHLDVDVNWDAAQRCLSIRSLEAVRRLPEFIDLLAVQEIHPREIGVRANTLEDVFIQLTGRSLRE